MKRSAVAAALFFTFLSFSAPAARAETDTALWKKLDDIEKDQKQILEELEQVRSELEIVKVRVTR